MVALRDGKPAGRIAAVINPDHNRHYSDKVGFFGFFDCIDDSEVSEALFKAAQAILLENGLDTMRGPYNPTINDECGVLVEGFESVPMVMMPYNPAYYMGLYEKGDFKSACDLNAFYVSANTTKPERVRRVVDRVKRSTGIEVRDLDMKNMDRDLKIICQLYNSTLDRNWGFVPITFEDLQFAAKDLKAIIEPHMVLIAEKAGEPVGFSMTLPNINEFLWKTRHAKGLLRVLKFLWHLKTSSPKEARLAVLGVHPKFRNKGVAPLFYYETWARGRQDYVGGELSWVEDSNTEMGKAIELMGGQKYKTYRIYERAL